MSNKRITDLTELTTPTTDDVFPVVDIATNTTTKVQLGNLPVPTSVTTALSTKENTITPGTTAQYYRGDKSFQTLDKTAVGLGNVDNTSDANKPVSTATQTALNAKQDTLVSGTNIKTINSTSLLGSGNITIAANPSGVAGAIQFSDGSAFASDATNFFWDDTNNRLGIGTAVPTRTLTVSGDGARIKDLNIGVTTGTTIGNTSNIILNFGSTGIGIKSNAVLQPTALFQIQGSGSTSATTSLLVQNSAGTASFTVNDAGAATVTSTLTCNSSIDVQGLVIGTGQRRLYSSNSSNANLVINTSGILASTSGFVASNASAVLEAVSTTQGFLPPRMTTTQKNAIATPAAGLVVYDSTTNKLCCYNGSTWNDLF